MLRVRAYPDPVLKRRAAPVQRIDQELLRLAEEMFRTMYEEQGIGLAAPQVGESVRLCVLNVSGKENGELVLINPVIVEARGEETGEEGCLSVPGVRSKVTRSAEVVVRAYDQNGNEIEMKADGLQARCLQHEIDHLNGCLFIERLGEAARQVIRPGLKALEEEFRKRTA